MSEVDASASGQFRIGDITINRLGYGAMRLTGSGIWGAPLGPQGCACYAAQASRGRHQFRRHGRQLRPRRIGTVDTRGAASLRRNADRYQSGLDAPRTRPVGIQRTPCISDCAGQGQPQETRRGTDRSLATSSHRPPCATRGAVRSRASAAGRRHHPPCRAKRGLGGRYRGCPQDIPGGDSTEPLQPDRPRQRERAGLLCRQRYRVHFPGFHSQPAS